MKSQMRKQIQSSKHINSWQKKGKNKKKTRKDKKKPLNWKERRGESYVHVRMKDTYRVRPMLLHPYTTLVMHIICKPNKTKANTMDKH